MSTIRETIETNYAATAFAERNLSEEATLLLKSEHQQSKTQAKAAKQVEKRPRPTLQAR
jgi:rRNA pseudouridine-1189 N-methylase Emg1 (Nep1/Mra1 family)